MTDTLMNRRHYRLRSCPPGLFLFDNGHSVTVGFKTEYGATVGGEVTHHAEPYCADTGEAFWGGTTKHIDRDALLVVPISLAELRGRA